MKQQMSFAQSEYAGKKKVTRREQFFSEMERMVTWARVVRGDGAALSAGQAGASADGQSQPPTRKKRRRRASHRPRQQYLAAHQRGGSIEQR